MNETFYNYRVRLHSKPGMWEYYDGHVDVTALSDAQAERFALGKLKNSFWDRPTNSWVIDKIERLGKA